MGIDNLKNPWVPNFKGILILGFKSLWWNVDVGLWWTWVCEERKRGDRMKTKTRGRSKATLDLSLFFIYLIKALPLKEEWLRHSIKSVVKGMRFLFLALPFKFDLRKITIISDKATKGGDFTLAIGLRDIKTLKKGFASIFKRAYFEYLWLWWQHMIEEWHDSWGVRWKLCDDASNRCKGFV